MNEGIHLDLDTWIVPGQIRKANLCIIIIHARLKPFSRKWLKIFDHLVWAGGLEGLLVNRLQGDFLNLQVNHQ